MDQAGRLHHSVHPELVEGPVHSEAGFDRLSPTGVGWTRPGNYTTPFTLSLSRGPCTPKQASTDPNRVGWTRTGDYTTPFTLSLSKGPCTPKQASTGSARVGWDGPEGRGAGSKGSARQATATGMPPMLDLIRASHSRGPVSCTETPFESTATVTGMSFTSNS